MTCINGLAEKHHACAGTDYMGPAGVLVDLRVGYLADKLGCNINRISCFGISGSLLLVVGAGRNPASAIQKSLMYSYVFRTSHKPPDGLTPEIEDLA